MTIDRDAIDPDEIYTINSNVAQAGELDLATGETTMFDASGQRHQTRVTGRQLLDAFDADGNFKGFGYAVTREELLVGEDGELIERDSAVPGDHHDDGEDQR